MKEKGHFLLPGIEFHLQTFRDINFETEIQIVLGRE